MEIYQIKAAKGYPAILIASHSDPYDFDADFDADARKIYKFLRGHVVSGTYESLKKLIENEKIEEKKILDSL